jgi:hypothetical protein
MFLVAVPEQCCRQVSECGPSGVQNSVVDRCLSAALAVYRTVLWTGGMYPDCLGVKLQVIDLSTFTV